MYTCSYFTDFPNNQRHYIYKKWLVSVVVLELRDQDFTWGLETKTSATWSRDQDQDLGHQVSRPRPKP